MKQTADIKVFISTRDSTCGECRENLGRRAWITLVREKGALCLSCSDLDHLIFLPTGDAALTRCARRHSTLSAVVLKWSRVRKRYERQGLLVETQALEQAERGCLADSDARARQREREGTRRTELDRQYVKGFARRVRELFPQCPSGREMAIAEHACLKYSGRIGRSAAGKKTYSLMDIIKKIKHELSLAGYKISISYNEKKTVQHAFIGFAELLHEAGVSPYREQKISIKIEIDTKPPEGAVLKTYTVYKYFPISFLSYDIPSLFAGKLHALLSRKYTKGRDFFDLGWYLSHWKDISPNLTLLENALKQTGWKGKIPTMDNWRDFVYDVVKKVDWDRVEKDIGKFPANPDDLKVFTKENVLQLVSD